jgi:hypothetical protein
MADHSINALRAAARAMTEVVLPAIDPRHPLAAEQAGLVAKYLHLFAERIDFVGARNRFELQHYGALAEALAADARRLSPAIAEALDTAAAGAGALLRDPAARPSALQAAARELAALVGALVRTAAEAEPGLRRRIEQRVLADAGALMQMQRAWFLPQGWEPDPAAVPPLERLLGPAAD